MDNENDQSDDVYRVTVADGKYTVILPQKSGMYALRHGERWRDLCGDGMVLALVTEIDTLRGMLHKPKEDKPAKAHIIRCNDGVEHAVIGTIAQAKEKMEELADAFYERNKSAFSKDYRNKEDYRNQYFWNIHSVGVSDETKE